MLTSGTIIQHIHDHATSGKGKKEIVKAKDVSFIEARFFLCQNNATMIKRNTSKPGKYRTLTEKLVQFKTKWLGQISKLPKIHFHQENSTNRTTKEREWKNSHYKQTKNKHKPFLQKIQNFLQKYKISSKAKVIAIPYSCTNNH